MVQQQVLWLEVSVHDIELVKILDTGDYLVEKFDGQWLFDSLILDDEVKKLTA